MQVSFFRFIFLAVISLVFVSAHESQRRFSATSTPERALFGYSSAEDCLFGGSSVLTRNVRFSTNDDEAPFHKVERDAETNKNEHVVPRPAFVVRTKSSKGM
mmetsp:Transcript_23598/g.42846  ORF Transcript_23598/g.42846 Transcript_23598/m.42846 type:complete len:102 (+) Transcript_23598:111-416(+)